MSGPWITRGDRQRQRLKSAAMQKLIDTPEDAARATEELAKAGVDVIKAYVQLTPATTIARLSKPPTATNCACTPTSTRRRDVRNALESGVDVLTHVGSAGTAPPYSPQLVQDIVNAGRPVVTTAAHRSWVFPDTVAFPERLQDPQLKRRLRGHPRAVGRSPVVAPAFSGPAVFRQGRPRDVLPRQGRQAVHRLWRGDGHGHRLRHADELPHRSALARDQGPRRSGDVAAAGDHGGDARQRASILGKARTSDDRSGKLADLIVVQGQSALRHRRAVACRGGREGRRRGQARRSPHE